jgi:predicted acetyltransferase
MTDPAGIEIRAPRPDEHRRFMQPLELGFAEDFDESEFQDDEHTLEWDRALGALDGERPVACSAAFSFRMTVPGGVEVPTAGSTLVAVEPVYRRRGILSAMIRRLLDDARRRAEPLSALWASEGTIYQRFGYGLATVGGSIELPTNAAMFPRPLERSGTIRLVEPEEAATLVPPLYDAYRRRTVGELSRTKEMWVHWLLREGSARARLGKKSIVVLERDGEARGYALYRAKADWDDRGPTGTVTLIEVVGADPAAEQTIWRWLLEMDLMTTVKAGRRPVPDPLMLQLAEPRALATKASDGIWLRILDVAAALEARSYVGDGRVVFELDDAFYPDLAGRWALEVAGGRGSVGRSEDAADLRLAVADLGSAYLGTFSFAALVRAGRVAEVSDGAVARADALFVTSEPPSCSTMF